MPISCKDLDDMRLQGKKIAMLTCYDASFARQADLAGVDILLVGDSLGMVIQGHDSTLPVTLDDIIYHTRCVARCTQRALLLSDLPFGSYQTSPQQALESSIKVMQAGAAMVKIEGGLPMVETVRFLSERGIPVCAHLGLTPQSVHQLSGYRVQGKQPEAAQALITAAQALQEAGARMALFELIPTSVMRDIDQALNIPTIGIGAGPHASGQVLVVYDILGLYPGKPARFVKNFLQGQDSIRSAMAAYVQQVKQGLYPEAQHCY